MEDQCSFEFKTILCFPLHLYIYGLKFLDVQSCKMRETFRLYLFLYASLAILSLRECSSILFEERENPDTREKMPSEFLINEHLRQPSIGDDFGISAPTGSNMETSCFLMRY